MLSDGMRYQAGAPSGIGSVTGPVVTGQAVTGQADDTMKLRVINPPAGAVPGPDDTLKLRLPEGLPLIPESRTPPVGPSPVGPPVGGRAERRRAARGQGHGRSKQGGGQQTPPRPAAGRHGRRTAAEPVGIQVVRGLGELCVTMGVVLLLFVSYQLWWTNVRAHQAADGAANRLEAQWTQGNSGGSRDPDDPRDPGAFAPGEGFAIIWIPKLDVKAPIAEGTDKHSVLDRGMVGHYDGALKSAMPWDKKGNFALAGHRNTHGEPFRYVNQLQPGDKVVVETAKAYYTYAVSSTLPQTDPSNISVIQPVPVGSKFTRPGRYITLTTCTPEFTSTFRLIVWGKMVDERPRSQGKPDALL